MPVTTVDELCRLVEAASASIPAIQSLYDSMPRDITAITAVGVDCPK